MRWMLKTNKTYCLFFLATLLFLFGCHRDSEIIQEQSIIENITYSSEDVIGTIENIYVDHWYDKTDRWEWRVIVRYEDLTLVNDGSVEGWDNAPYFLNMKIGDKVDIKVITKYVNGIKENRFIERIK